MLQLNVFGLLILDSDYQLTLPMNKSLSWKALLLIAVIAEILRQVLGGIIGDFIGLLGLICFLMAIVAFLRNKKHSGTIS
jgi:cobalamin synthase